MTSAGQAVLARRLRTQARACADLGSPFYAQLMERAALDVEAGGVIRALLEGHEADPGPSALALRLFGGLHRLALDGRAPGLAAHFPSTGGDGDTVRAAEAVLEAVREHFEALQPLLLQGVQTNEVGRSAALLGGFLTVARESGLPLRVLELGASGGLNLRWDSYRYTNGDWAWGDPASRLHLDGHFAGRVPDDADAVVADRRGCDAAPVDTTTDEGRLRLQCFVWPDQHDRMARLRAALVVAAVMPAKVDRADASEWLGERLTERVPGMATVVFHSVFWQYLTDAGRDDCVARLGEAGVAASVDAPVYWLRMEPANRRFEVSLTAWPGGRDRLLATCNAHGGNIHWGPGDV